MVLVLVHITSAQEECNRESTPADIPCTIMSSWTYGQECSTYEVKVYNETPSLLDTRSMDNYSATGRCNITFNYSKRGSYLLNFSSGESATIIVEADDMAYITIGIMLGIITFIFAYLSVKAKHWAIQISLSLFTLIMVVYDFFISARIIETIEAAETGIVQTLDTFFFIAVQLFRFALIAATIYVLYYAWQYVLYAPLRKRIRRSESEDLYGR